MSRFSSSLLLGLILQLCCSSRGQRVGRVRRSLVPEKSSQLVFLPQRVKFEDQPPELLPDSKRVQFAPLPPPPVKLKPSEVPKQVLDANPPNKEALEPPPRRLNKVQRAMQQGTVRETRVVTKRKRKKKKKNGWKGAFEN